MQEFRERFERIEKQLVDLTRDVRDLEEPTNDVVRRLVLYCRKNIWQLPQFDVLPQKDGTHTVICRVVEGRGRTVYGKGVGSNELEAERNASEDCMQRLHYKLNQ